MIDEKKLIEELEWIPCSERLPDDRKEKLVYLSSNRFEVAVYNEHRLPHSGCPIGWGYRVPGSYIDFENETVIAWMPLHEFHKGLISVDSQEIKIACMVCCPWCDEEKCVGRFNCKEIKNYVNRLWEKVGE